MLVSFIISLNSLFFAEYRTGTEFQTMTRKFMFSSRKTYIASEEPFYCGEQSRLFLAQDTRFHRNVVIKEMDHEPAAQEVTVCCKISDFSSQVPVIFDVCRENGKTFIIMQWIAGKDLSEVLESPRGFSANMRIAQDLCAVLAVLHRNHYEHRDLKPQNIRIGNDGRVYLMDFNLSAVRTHRGFGSNAYRAPECDPSYSIKPAGTMDVFSAGVILYQLFTSHLPIPFVDYAADSSDSSWVVFREPKEFMPSMPPALNNLITRCMKMNPRERFRSAGEILTALRAVKRR